MKRNQIIYIASALLIGCGICISCANRGIGPQGGPKDETPPVVLKSTPENGTLHFKAQRIEIQFDEYVQLEDVSNNVLMSPPQQQPPEIKSLGKKVRIDFKEPLQDSTTYTLDFGAAIVDNNERNPLSGFVYSFSTGDVIDSLEIYGTLLNAEDLNPISGITIGYHSNLEDSAFSTLPFCRIGRTDNYGEFSIKNIPPGTYRLYGLGEASRDYRYQPGDGVAFLDSLITPYINITTESDTIFRRDTLAADSSLIPDSIITSEYYYYEPSNLVLFYFQENKQKKYFQRALRDKAHCFTLYFAGAQDTLPQLKALRLPSDSLQQDSAWVDFTQYMLIDANPTKDTITYWLTDSAAIRMDTIRFEMTYLKSDSLYELYPQTDTIQAIYREPRLSDKARENKRKKEMSTPLAIDLKKQGTLEIYDTLMLTSATPLVRIEQDSLHLYQMVDTVRKKIAFQLQAADSSYRRFYIIFPMTQNCNYEFELDSAAAQDIYNKVNIRKKCSFNIRNIEEYASLKVILKDYDATAIIQLLDEKDTPVRTLKADPAGTTFMHLLPKKYYLRLFLDLNGDGKWTTGDWSKHQQPEPVYYCHKKLNLRANWDFEEQFDWKNIPILQQKPEEIKKDANPNKK